MSTRIRPSEAVKLDANGNPAHDRTKPWGDTVKMLDECQLDRLLHRTGQISEGQFANGVWFRSRWLAAHTVGGFGIRYGERVQGGGWLSQSDHRLTAEDEVRAAMAGMPEKMALAVQAVCGEDQRAAGRVEELRAGLDWIGAFREKRARQRRKAA